MRRINRQSPFCIHVCEDQMPHFFWKVLGRQRWYTHSCDRYGARECIMSMMGCCEDDTNSDCVWRGVWGGVLLWVMAPVWQGPGKWSRSDQYVIMLTTIPSLHFVAWDKSIKDPSCSIVAIHCQQQKDSDKEVGGGKRGQNTKTQGHFESWPVVCIARNCSWLVLVDWQLRGIILAANVIPSPCRWSPIDGVLTNILTSVTLFLKRCWDNVCEKHTS